MNTSNKLTLRLNAQLILRAKRYAKKNNTSLSHLVESYFLFIEKKDLVSEKQAAHLPVTQSLIGILKNTHLSEKAYQDYLVKKYL